ncbi:MAG: hypothetical protein MI924_23290, partial [Chloroflexales bacterium]|nr:hypothetical protein [Chloroflexales bacterium]
MLSSLRRTLNDSGAVLIPAFTAMRWFPLAREWGIPYALTLAAAWQFGGMDTTADEAAIVIGYRAVRIRPPNGQRLCAQIWQWPRTWTHHAS